MIEIKKPHAKAYKRERKAPDGTTYIELLFLQSDDLTPENIDDAEKRHTVIPGVEDRKVFVTILGETFYARLVRKTIGTSYGIQISNLLEKYFGITILYVYCGPYEKESKIAFKTTQKSYYCYNLEEIKPSWTIKPIPKDKQCPLDNNDYKPEYNTSTCDGCPFFLKKTYYHREEKDPIRHQKQFTGCLRPGLKWPE